MDLFRGHFLDNTNSTDSTAIMNHHHYPSSTALHHHNHNHNLLTTSNIHNENNGTVGYGPGGGGVGSIQHHQQQNHNQHHNLYNSLPLSSLLLSSSSSSSSSPSSSSSSSSSLPSPSSMSSSSSSSSPSSNGDQSPVINGHNNNNNLNQNPYHSNHHTNHYHQRNPFIGRSKCVVCNDRARGCNFGAITCASCKEFFRRNAFKLNKLKCYFQSKCEINIYSRRFCAACRLAKCYKMGMKNEYIMSDQEKYERNLKIIERKSSTPAPASITPINNLNLKNDNANIMVDFHHHQINDNNGIIQSLANNTRLINIVGENRNSNNKVNSSTNDPISPSSPSFSEYSSSEFSFDGCGNGSGCRSPLTPPPHPRQSSSNLNRNPVKDCHHQHYHHHHHHQNNLQLRNGSFVFPDDHHHHDHHNYKESSQDIISKEEEEIDEGKLERFEPQNGIKTCNDSARYQNPDFLNEDPPETVIKLLKKVRIIRESSYSVDKFRLLLLAKDTKRQLSEHGSCRLKYLTSIVQILSAETVSDLPTDQKFIDLIRIAEIVTFNFIKMCKKLYAFQALNQEDQVALVKGSVMDTLLIWSMMTINLEKECWEALDLERNFRFSLKMEMLKEANPKLYEKHRSYVMSFEPEWRHDDNLMSLLIAIALFNPDRPNLSNVEMIKSEKNSYCNLLKLYLSSLHDEESTSKEIYLRLMNQIKMTEKISEYHIKTYFDLSANEATRNGFGGLIMEIFDLNT